MKLTENEKDKLKAEIESWKTHQILDLSRYNFWLLISLGIISSALAIFVPLATVFVERYPLIITELFLILSIITILSVRERYYKIADKSNKAWMTRDRIIAENYLELYDLSREVMEKRFKEKWREIGYGEWK